WGAPIAVSDNPAGVTASPPSLAADGASVYVTWADGRTGGVKEVQLARSSDGGASFGPAAPVSTPDGFSSWTPSVRAAAGPVPRPDAANPAGGAPGGATPGGEEESPRRPLDGGATWDAERRLTADPPGAPTESWAPSLAVADGAVHMTFLDKRSGTF